MGVDMYVWVCMYVCVCMYVHMNVYECVCVAYSYVQMCLLYLHSNIIMCLQRHALHTQVQ